MNLKKSFKLSCTLSIDFVEFSLKFKQIIILIFHSSFCFFFISKIISFGFQLPAVQLCYCVGFRISLSLSREGAIFQDEIENYFSCSHLARRDWDRDENEITYSYSHVSRRDWDFRKSFLVAKRQKMNLTLVENSCWPLAGILVPVYSRDEWKPLILVPKLWNGMFHSLPVP